MNTLEQTRPKNKFESICSIIYDIYYAIGVAVTGLLCFFMIVVVLLRYMFSISQSWMEGFVILLFSFITYWSLGYLHLKKEHIFIDGVYSMFKPKVQRIIDFFNTGLILVMNIAFVIYSIEFIRVVGGPISPSLRLPLKYMYSVMPIGFAIAAVCAVAVFYKLIKEAKR